MKNNKERTYAEAMKELEEISEYLENADIDIDKMNELVLKAAELIQFCRSKLLQSEKILEEIGQKKENNSHS
ncbi:MAG: exodeoxyribonuclease VII small subunit [Chitinophagaceae bacterium]|nr:exodeoxyribonuclease VII small subunit [Chitinophagaceae bacterium]